MKNFINDYISKNEVYFFHSPYLHGKRATVAGIVKENTSGQNVLQVGASLCSSHDNFCKADGRARATSRAIGSKTRSTVSISSTKGKDIRSAMNDYAQTLLTASSTPVLNGNLI